MSLWIINSAAFLVVTLGVVGAWYWLTEVADPDRRKALSRLRGLNGVPAPMLPPINHRDWAEPLIRWLSNLGGFLGSQGAQLRNRLIFAGLTSPNAPALFLGVKVLLALTLAALGVAAGGLFGEKLVANLPTWFYCTAGGLVGLNVGLLGTEWWLGGQVAVRQDALRHALPDALDMLVLCLEGGVTINAALQRVTDQLDHVHPMLAQEFVIVQQEILLGLTAGEALRKLADRCGLTDVRDLAMVLIQSDRYGASLSKTLRTYADNARHDRQQRAEERAQQSAVKIVFPTLLCIFPAIFIVLLGPAALQLSKLFAR